MATRIPYDTQSVSLNLLTDTKLENLSNDNILQYNSSTKKWENKNIANEIELNLVDPPIDPRIPNVTAVVTYVFAIFTILVSQVNQLLETAFAGLGLASRYGVANSRTDTPAEFILPTLELLNTELDNLVLNNPTELNQLTDVDLPSTPFEYQILTYNGTKWVAGIYNPTLFQQSVSIGTSKYPSRSVSIGFDANARTTGEERTTIGHQAGELGSSSKSCAFGFQAGRNNQVNDATAIGWKAGYEGQKYRAVALGFEAGNDNQGQYSVCLGTKCGTNGEGEYNITIGNQCGNTADNSIVFNASATPFNKSTQGMFIAPGTIQGSALGLGVGVLHYDTTTGEIKVSTT